MTGHQLVSAGRCGCSWRRQQAPSWKSIFCAFYRRSARRCGQHRLFVKQQVAEALVVCQVSRYTPKDVSFPPCCTSVNKYSAHGTGRLCMRAVVRSCLPRSFVQRRVFGGRPQAMNQRRVCNGTRSETTGCCYRYARCFTRDQDQATPTTPQAITQATAKTRECVGARAGRGGGSAHHT